MNCREPALHPRWELPKALLRVRNRIEGQGQLLTSFLRRRREGNDLPTSSRATARLLSLWSNIGSTQCEPQVKLSNQAKKESARRVSLVEQPTVIIATRMPAWLFLFPKYRKAKRLFAYTCPDVVPFGSEFETCFTPASNLTLPLQLVMISYLELLTTPRVGRELLRSALHSGSFLDGYANQAVQG